MESCSPPVTFITYALYGIKTSPAWTLPNFEQVISSCGWGYRLIAVGSESRCDVMPKGSFVIQHGASITALVLDCGVEFCSYAFTHADSTRVPLTTEDGSVLVVPFCGWVCVGRDRCLRSLSGGVLTISWDVSQTAYISVAVYRPSTVQCHALTCTNVETTGSSNAAITDGSDSEPSVFANQEADNTQDQDGGPDFLETILMESDLYGANGPALMEPCFTGLSDDSLP
ncbi:nuclear protein UL4 [Equid alphaherpesvirus 4]|uniref:58 n=2 Tax=Equid alphaherpesvirus 4 TaxID=10331 RepID=A0A288CFW2_EHV4|nr:nuclear protein UL4 [Equid alphaherpesvirus 4]AAC59576.1 58 [Equid alphaherpesvirus 4]AMB15944.1 nuclear protein UL4 [Equid alphaherpesvirus 4]AMB16023.1 nuclear protein UL4 [Equid alphaherpesvirus 4]AMB16102.1 nuclear protein UL4 [Equid alphaherpesvirus 4]AMB16181.1 nuclear protein UL4 [Equid alphaherpesvirus 4]